jgi:hypothetical protein
LDAADLQILEEHRSATFRPAARIEFRRALPNTHLRDIGAFLLM